jgi:hypothetical protein
MPYPLPWKKKISGYVIWGEYEKEKENLKGKGGKRKEKRNGNISVFHRWAPYSLKR